MKTGRKPKEEAPFGQPIPTRFDPDQEAMIRGLAASLGLPRSEIIKRACAYMLPKFASGEVPLVAMPKTQGDLELSAG